MQNLKPICFDMTHRFRWACPLLELALKNRLIKLLWARLDDKQWPNYIGRNNSYKHHLKSWLVSLLFWHISPSDRPSWFANATQSLLEKTISQLFNVEYFNHFPTCHLSESMTLNIGIYDVREEMYSCGLEKPLLPHQDSRNFFLYAKLQLSIDGRFYGRSSLRRP